MSVCLLLLAPFTVHLAARSVAHAPRRAAAPRLQTADPERSAVSWQEELEQLLAPATGQEEREFLLRDLLSRGPEIADEVRAAVSSGEYADLLPPPDSQSRRLLDDSVFPRRRRAFAARGSLSADDFGRLSCVKGPGVARPAA